MVEFFLVPEKKLKICEFIFGVIFNFQDYTITMYLDQYWKDERLAFSTEDETLTLAGDFAEKIWVPDTFFANDKNRYFQWDYRLLGRPLSLPALSQKCLCNFQLSS